jgi:predicted dehydrogenase
MLGSGAVAEAHLTAIRSLDGVRVVGVFSRTEERARRTGEREGCVWTTDPGTLLGHPDVDVAVIATSSGSHAALALRALEAGKHLLVEKPIAMNCGDATRMIHAAAGRGLTLGVVSQRRFEELNRIIHSVLAQGALGKLLGVQVTCPYHRTQEYYDSADWRGTRSADGGLLMNRAIHSVDLMLWLAGPARRVFGRIPTQTHRIEVEDAGAAVLEFASGALGTLLASTSVQPGGPPRLDLYGDKGTIRTQGNELVEWRVPGIPAPDTTGFAASGTGRQPGSMNPRFLHLQLQDLVDSLAQGRRPAVTGDDGLHARAVAEAISTSSDRGGAIDLGSQWRNTDVG